MFSPEPQWLHLHDIMGPRERAHLSYLETQGGVTTEVAFLSGLVEPARVVRTICLQFPTMKLNKIGKEEGGLCKERVQCK